LGTKEHNITYEELIAAMMLKKGKTDLLELSLIIDDIRKDYGYVYIDYFNEYSYEKLLPYIEVLKDNSIILNPKYNLDDYINDDLTLRKFFEHKSKDLSFYFDELDILNWIDNCKYSSVDQEIQAKKEFMLKKDKVTKNANVLLISTHPNNSDYELLESYGFKKINTFKSIIVADKYFKEHPEELENYDIVFIGKNSYDWHYLNTSCNLIKKIQELISKNKIVYSEDYNYNYDNILSHGFDYRILENDYKWWNNYAGSFGCCLEKMVNDILTKSKLDKEFIPVRLEDKNSIGYPKRKKDIKILLALNNQDETFINELKREITHLGLNVDIVLDNNYALYDDLMYKIGDYDIMIASDYSSNLINFAYLEAFEQDKLTGRRFNVLATFKNVNETDIDPDTKTNVTYTISNNNKNYDKRNSYVINKIKEDNYEVKEIIGVIESLIWVFDNELHCIEDNHYKSPEDIESAYQQDIEKREYFKYKREYDELYRLASSYLENGSNRNIGNYRIYALDRDIKIEKIENNRIVSCLILLDINNYFEGSRAIGIQDLTKNGDLSKIRLRLLCNKFEGILNNNTPKLNEKEYEMYTSIRNDILEKMNANEDKHIKIRVL
jgi:hypothetical protein